MKALFIVSKGVLEIREQPNPEAGAGEVLVRVRAAGVNNADLVPPGRRPRQSHDQRVRRRGILNRRAGVIDHQRPKCRLKPRLKLTARSCPSRIVEMS
jgi:hypothetical protein